MKLTMTRQPRNERLPAMSHLEIGNQLFHNGVPVQLLYRVRRDKSRETWRVRPLFVEGPDRNELFSCVGYHFVLAHHESTPLELRGISRRPRLLQLD
jgi:hypothetical protein